MKFPQSFIEEIKARVPVSDVVRRRVKLQKAGREWRGLSPFTPEKTPSFYVNDQKQAWFDFSAGKNGSIFDFIIETEGVSFPEAVERLAHMAGLPLPHVTPEAEAREKVRAGLQEVTEWAAQFFESRLQAPEGEKARAYLAGRGIAPAIQREFRLGFAPNEKFALRDALAAKGATTDVMVEAGLLIAHEEVAVPYDRFRDRVMFPIQDRAGRAIAFGGRAMEKDVQAKYLNSPETPLFHKGAVLYNHHRARKAAHDKGTVVAVEGYVDVIALAMAGIGEAVAPLGTALTPDQCELLWKMAEEPVLCFDGDRAGRKAAYRAVDTALPLLSAAKTFRFALLPDGQDPDDLVRSGGASAMKSILADAKPLVEVLWMREVESGPLDTPERRSGLEHRLSDILRQIADQGLRRHYRDAFDQRLALLFGGAAASPTRFSARGRGGPARMPFRPGGRGRGFVVEPRGYLSDPVPVGSAMAQSLAGRAAPPREALILLLALNHPNLLENHVEELASLDFEGADTSRLRHALLAIGGGGVEDAARLRTDLEAAGLGAIIARLEQSAAVSPIWSIRPETAQSDAEAVMGQALGLHRRARALHKELKLAELALGFEASEPNLARMRDIQTQLSALEGTEAAIEGFGALSGRAGQAV